MSPTCQLARIALVVSTLLACWLGMQAVHELGHVLGAFATGGRIERVVLHPLAISRTDVWPNPEPLLVVWAGPLIGVGLPLLFWAIASAWKFEESVLLRFYAGFCLIANGLYIGVGSFDGIGDCGDMLQHGSPIWALWIFGLATVPIGFLLWHGQAKRFGFTKDGQPPSLRLAISSSIACVALLVLGMLTGK